MSNKEHAEGALVHARRMLGHFKSANKRYDLDEARQSNDPKKKGKAYNREVRGMRAEKVIPGPHEWAKDAAAFPRMDYLNKYNKAPTKDEESDMVYSELSKIIGTGENIDAGNCLEYSIVARNYVLSKEKHAHVHMIKLVEGDHIFVAIGIEKPEGLTPNVSNWGKDVWICDPWAGIACPCAEYAKQWEDKMDEWAGKGKRLMCKAGLQNPSDTAWKAAIRGKQKRIVNMDT